MEDLISRAKLLQKIKEAQDALMSNDDKTWERNKNRYKGLAWAHRLILDAEAIDAEPVRHGRWQGEGDGYADGKIILDVWQCSECGHTIDGGTNDPSLLPNYCPNCGSKMGWIVKWPEKLGE